MPKATVAQPFHWRVGHSVVRVEVGEQQLTDEQYAHAEQHGFLQKQQPAKTKSKPEVLDHGND